MYSHAIPEFQKNYSLIFPDGKFPTPTVTFTYHDYTYWVNWVLKNNPMTSIDHVRKNLKLIGINEDPGGKYYRYMVLRSAMFASLTVDQYPIDFVNLEQNDATSGFIHRVVDK